MTDDEKGIVDALDLSLFQKFRLAVAVPVMKEILLDLWNDPAKARAIGRSGLAVLAGMILSGKLSFANATLESWAWNAATFVGLVLAIPAGQTNRKPEEIKGIAQDPNIAAQPPKP